MKASEKKELTSINESLVDVIMNLHNHIVNGKIVDEKFVSGTYTDMCNMFDKLYLIKKNISQLINN